MSTPGMDEPGAPAPIELSAQIADVDIDHVARWLGGKIIDVTPDFLARDDLAPARGEVFQQRVLAGRKLHEVAGAAHRAGVGVDLEVPFQ